MAGDSSPHNACGQILFCLKMSKLNYVVKETPYSAYVTIRKKFIPSVEDKQEPLYVNKNLDELKKAEKEIVSLKQKNNDLESRIALAIIDLNNLKQSMKHWTRKILNLKTALRKFTKKIGN